MIDPSSKTVTGVEFIRNGNNFGSVRVSKEVVLSAGTLNTPQLLMLSGVGPRDDLQALNIPVIHDSPGVGKNLHNHVAFFVKFYYGNETEKDSDLDWPAAVEYLLSRNGPLSSTGMSQVTAKVNSRYADPKGDHPDVQFFFLGHLANCPSENPSQPHKERNFVGVHPVVLHPKSRGYLKLKSNNPRDPPLMYANYLTAPEDIATLIDAIKMILRLGETNVLKNQWGFQLDTTPVESCIGAGAFGSDSYWECAVRHSTGPENHQVGTCKMGPDSDPQAVVDPSLKVRGIRSLRVMDASIIPTVISGNTNAPAIMIAEKGVDIIKNNWGQGNNNNVNFGDRFGGASAPGSAQGSPLTQTGNPVNGPYPFPPQHHHPPPGYLPPAPQGYVYPRPPTGREFVLPNRRNDGNNNGNGNQWNQGNQVNEWQRQQASTWPGAQSNNGYTTGYTSRHWNTATKNGFSLTNGQQTTPNNNQGAWNNNNNG